MSTLNEPSDGWFDDVWRRVREQLRAEMDALRFQYWIASLRVLSADRARVTIGCRTPHLRDQTYVKFGQRIADLIAASVPTLGGVDFVVAPAAEPPAAPTRLRTVRGGVAGSGATAARPTTPTSVGIEGADAAGPTKKGEPRILIEDVKRAVAEHFAITVGDLESHSRKRAVVRPRQIAMHVARTLTGRSYPEIARRFGARDHTTVIYGCEKIRRQSELDPAMAAEIAALMHLVAG